MSNNTPCSTVAIALLFGSLTFTTTTLAARLWLANLWTWRDGGRPLSSSNIQHSKEALDINSLPSIYNLLHHSCVFGFILCYSYICENHPPFMHEEKDVYDRDEFLFCVVILVVAGVHSWKQNIQEKKYVKKSDDYNAIQKRGIDAEESYTQPTNQVAPLPEPETEVLNRNQTEEWKGWMQFIFLLYHYMHATEVYNGIRVLITCYVWLTGFGNFLFFYKTNDYSLPRLLQMLWRLNFLVIFLCLTHGNSYILYYICPLHTFYFLMVYVVMYIAKDMNHTVWWIRFKLGAMALIIFVVWDCNFGVFEGIHSFLLLGEEAVTGAPYGTKWEWYFRSFLDHYSALLGMIFALNLPVVSLFYRKLEARSFGRQWVGKLSVLAAMVCAFTQWANGPLTMDKEQYNTTNPYFGFIPLLLYVYVRNLTPTLRSHSMGLLQEIGKTTLETYAMQHHVWLTSDSKTILVFLPNYRRLNMMLVTLTYIAISRKVYKLTGVLRNILLPNDRQQCVKTIAAMVFVLLISYMTSFILCRMNLVGTTTIFVISVVIGGLLYQSIMDSTWYQYHSTVKKISDEGDDEDEKTFMDRSELSFSIVRDLDKESIVTKLCPPMIGVLLLFVLGSIWNAIVVAGASSVGPLSPDCAAFANQGSWVTVDVCNESNRAMVYRNHNAASGVCPSQGGAYIWAWDVQPAHTHCRFGYRSESKLKREMNGRKLLFIGDSMTRNLYHASLRAMGVKKAGAYDATITKHSDLMQDFNNASINFKWAPLASDQLNSLRSINDSVENGGGGSDLIVMGGGAWDRLHVYATDEDRKSHANTLKALSNDMMKSQILGIQVIWVVPTTINSQALNTEEKRDHMREEDMEAMRAVYSINGILSSASFVIDGTAFTASRVSESFDGVHYPHQVYDGGAQILFQSLDWLFPKNYSNTSTTPKDIGTMPNAVFGILLLALIGIGLISFDGFLGFSYLACLFVKGVKPCDVYNDVSSEHAKPRSDQQRLKGRDSCTQTRPKKSPSSTVGDDSIDNEIAALLR